ncbi:MAG: hypothetical protein M3P96_01205 [Actinomycetota bacterium]|nr:hypothetical protein [Actinomycetota bacterium]
MEATPTEHPVDGFTVFSPQELPGWLDSDRVYLLVLCDGRTYGAEAVATADPTVFLGWHWGDVRLVSASDFRDLPRWLEPDPVGLLAHLLPQLGLEHL